MPVTFKSQATGPLLMLSAHAEALLLALGKTAGAPGILEVADMPAALTLLRGLADEPAAEPVPVPTPDDGEAPEAPGFADEAVSLRQRAVPFIRMIEQAQAGGQPIVWGV
jgi:Domain of unknown function (DUF1840)